MVFGGKSGGCEGRRAVEAVVVACRRLGFRLGGLGVLIAGMLLLAGCGEKKPAFYYLMEFDGVVEGEPFAFRTRVACYPYDISGGTPGRKSRVYRAGRMSFGKKLASGRGVFVGAPFACGLVGDTEGPMVPLIYITDNYETPRHLWAYANPAGPEPGSGVEIRHCVIRQFKSPQEAERVPSLAKDMHDPFHDFSPRLMSWDVVDVLPTGINDPLPAERRVYTSPDGRWEMFDDPEASRHLHPGARANSYWAGVTRSGPLNVLIDRALRDKGLARVAVEDYKFAAWVYARNPRVYVEDGRLVVDPSVHGIVDAYEGRAMPWGDETISVTVGGGTAVLPMASFRLRSSVFLYDKQTSQLYRFGKSFFHA